MGLKIATTSSGHVHHCTSTVHNYYNRTDRVFRLLIVLWLDWFVWYCGCVESPQLTGVGSLFGDNVCHPVCGPAAVGETTLALRGRGGANVIPYSG